MGLLLMSLLYCQMIRSSQFWVKNIWVAAILLVYTFFCYQMALITLQYLPIDRDIAFLRIKQEYVSLWYYSLAFFVHVFSSIWVLGAGFSQFSKQLLRHQAHWHRRFGWFYVLVILFLAGPSGLLIGIFANGGWSSQLAFCLLAILWMGFTLLAVLKARQREYQAHRAWMIRSFALTLSAISLRAWKYVLVALFHPRPMDVYILVAWLGWVLNLLVAEFIIARMNRNKR